VRLLLVEDDAMLGETVQVGLRQDGYAVDWVRDTDQADSAIRTHDYAAVLLDLGLPKRDGLDFLRAVRARAVRVPIVIVTARDSISQRIAGLDAGADDYVTKPFDLNELSARVRAVARRAQGRVQEELVTGEVRLDTAAKRCSLSGDAVELTGREYRVALFLMERMGRIVARTELEEAMFEWSREVESNAVEVYVSQLRKKLGREFITTHRGLGYCVERREAVA
jgi:two-component system, OmpR family, response regulator QseB